MRDILEPVEEWLRRGERVAVARVVDVEGSGPRGPGAALAVNEQGEVVGSVSGGCVEGAVVAEAMDVLPAGPGRLISFGYSDDDAFAVGLTCGGTIHLFVEPWTDHGHEAGPTGSLAGAIRSGRAVALATVIDGHACGAKLLVPAGGEPGSAVEGTLGDAGLDRTVRRDAAGVLAGGGTALRRYGSHGEADGDAVTVFVETFAPPARMIVLGAADFTAALAGVAKTIGYRVTVCDARPVFATTARFPLADEVLAEWPDRLIDRIGPELTSQDAVCVLTHDAKFDVPALVAALATDVGYIGAMGSRRTHAERDRRLRSAGVTEEDLDRIRSPIGLDIGGRTPGETAVAICAEIIAQRAGRTEVRPLAETEGPIHR